jgi:death on curing protein
VRNHPFFDGNKRVSLMSAILFLEINGMRFVATEEEAVLETLALAAGQSSEEGFAGWLARNVKKA